MQSGQQRFEGISLYAVEATRGYAYPPISWQLPTVLEIARCPPRVVALALACAGLPAPWAQRGIGALDNAAGTLYVAWPARATRDANASRQLSSALELKT